MSKDPIPLVVPDISSFARALGRQFAEPGAPSHLQLMNMLARAAGFRNYQHLRASQTARSRLDGQRVEQEPDYAFVERALHHFDAGGRLVRWPAQRSVQVACLWHLWSRFPAAAVLCERDVNALLNPLHLFADAALLRRELCDLGLLTRNRDGSQYRRVGRQPPPEARELIRRLRVRGDGPATRSPGS